VPSTNGQESVDSALPSRLEVERISREFTKVFHALKDQTFATTTWLGVPLVKSPSDILVLQQIICETRPELIVETGVYLGGSALLYASLLDALGIDGKVVAVDIDISAVYAPAREHPRIELLEGSSTDPEVASRIRALAEGKRTMVDLDSDHRAHHVLEELRTYSSLVTPGCYLVVEDCFLGGRPVRPEAVPGPSEALEAWLADNPPFENDRWRERFLLTQNPRGYLRRVGDGAGDPKPERPEYFITGALELSAEAGGSVTVAEGEEAIAVQTDYADEPDRMVEATRKAVLNSLQTDRQTRIEAELDRRRQDLTVEGLLRELDVQRELLQERHRLLMRERGRVRHIEESLPFRIYRGFRKIPGLSSVFAWRDRKRVAAQKARVRNRSANRDVQEQRFTEHHRGQ
jgi:cephalosporin hydroxylase